MLAAGCDGVPFHKDQQSSSGWPFVVTNEGLPAGTYRKNQHQHIFALTPSEEWRYDANKKPFIYKTDPKSIQPVLLMFTDELLHGQDTGFQMRDFSVPVGHPQHVFLLKCILLFFMGDYPGQGKVANMKHQGGKTCHWCMHPFQQHSPGHCVATGTRRHLPDTDPTRTDDTYGAAETRPPPAMRDHATTCAHCKDKLWPR